MLVPERVKFVCNHLAIDVQVVAFLNAVFAIDFKAFFTIAGTNSAPFGREGRIGKTAVEQLSNCATVLINHGLSQTVDGSFKRAAIVFFLICFAIALEATSLIDVEEGASKFPGRQGMIQPFCTQFVRIQYLQLFTLFLISRKKSMLNQLFCHAYFATQQAVTSSAHRTRCAARHGQ